MAPIGVTTRRDGEQMVIHHCLGCGAVRRNRIAADDDFTAVLALPALATGVPTGEDERHIA